MENSGKNPFWLLYFACNPWLLHLRMVKSFKSFCMDPVFRVIPESNLDISVLNFLTFQWDLFIILFVTAFEDCLYQSLFTFYLL